MTEVDLNKYYYDEEAAEKAVRFIEKYLTHTKGEWGGKPFILEEWQKSEIIKPIFGWKHLDTGLRKYRTAFIFLPRKNGKSALAACIILTLMFIDNEPGAEYYSAANDREQAKLVFEAAKGMVNNKPELGQYLKCFRNSITYDAQGSFYKAISSESGTKHGFNVSAAIYDELHAMKSDSENLYQVLETATGARQQPLMVAITTAGYDTTSECYKMYNYAKRVEEGALKDDAFLSVIYEASPDDDIQSEETWKKANPNFGVSLKADYMKREALKAATLPSYENIFRRLMLNQWTGSDVRWISDKIWVENDHVIDENKLISLPCYGGLDLASTRDLTCFALVWQIDDYYIYKHWTFLPEEKYFSRNGLKDGVNYTEWGDILEVTDGNATDFNYVEAKILTLKQQYNIQSIAYDRYNSSQLVLNLAEKGLKMSPFGQGFVSMSPPTKALEIKLLNKEVVHYGCPVLRWQIGNVQLSTNDAGDVKPTKGKAKDKIDSIVAMLMATGEMIFTEREERSVYQEGRGFLSI
jgi:phage terminase large subunit-like protein